jgi:hypothetical protein
MCSIPLAGKHGAVFYCTATALLLDGASARARVLNTESFPTAAVLIDNAIPTTAQR